MAATGAAILLAACGSSSSGGGGGAGSSTPGFFLTIQGMAFSPIPLAVPPGGTVTVLNRDSMAHTVTSEAAENDFTKGSVGGVEFDTGSFTGQAQFTIPASAADGTLIPFFCNIHKGSMATPNGTIKVDSTAQPAAPPGGGGGGGGY
ncbi:MAG TPA: hypothetical protein VFG59_06175 [Anaeromyxobacter sp.]|nr:hypothetical protein [Anaeromyxobacter sp.]